MIKANIVTGLADLAEAAYIDFGPAASNGLTIDELKAKLSEAAYASTWPESRRNAFVSEWRVVAHRPNMPSGFSATVFERLNPKPGESRYVFAARGTEVTNWGDIEADLGDMVANGLAWEQIIDMYNWWKELTTPLGGSYQWVIGVMGHRGQVLPFAPQ